MGAALSIWHRHLGMPRESAEKRGTWRLGEEEEREEKISSSEKRKTEDFFEWTEQGSDAPASGERPPPRAGGAPLFHSKKSLFFFLPLPPYEDGMSGAFLGPSYPSEEIAAWLESRHYPYRTVSR